MERDNCALGPLEHRVSVLEERVSKLEGRMDRFEDVVRGIHEQIGEIRERLGRIEGMVSGLRTAMTIGFTLVGTILAAILYVLYMLATAG